MVIFPVDEDLRFWVLNLDERLKPFLPAIDDSWYQDMISCFQIAAMRPDCKESVCRAGSVIFHKIIKNHYLVDGNKRSAVLCTYLIFSVNVLPLALTPDELYESARQVAQSKEAPDKLIAALTDYFEKSCRAKP